LQQIYKIVANRFFIKIDNNSNIITINNNFVVAKLKQLKTKSIENCSHFVRINIKSFALNISRIVFDKNVDKYIVFIKYLVIVYILETKYICLYIKDRSRDQIL